MALVCTFSLGEMYMYNRVHIVAWHKVNEKDKAEVFGWGQGDGQGWDQGETIYNVIN